MIHGHRVTPIGLGVLLTALSFAPAPPEPAPLPPAVIEAAQERLKAALKAFDETWVYYRQARTDVFDVFAFSKLALESQAELCQTKDEYIAALEAHRDRMRELDRLVKRVRRIGFSQTLDLAAADYYIKDAEYRVLRAKAEK